jgi:hypothetical protein
LIIERSAKGVRKNHARAVSRHYTRALGVGSASGITNLARLNPKIYRHFGRWPILGVAAEATAANLS